MEGWQIAIIVKPLALIVLFSFTFVVSRWIWRRLPDGKLRRFLFISWRV